ncbi:hypothetical protein [Halosolutus gelatinilyticus]|uniref:hypothetical protein n=1 Tax=Halosolutus gelatinilyticus TaxID=2931975 RepID=UPI001FF6149E|nr:hypothetical protein [Halosolutus gelatinilyticus]
MVTLPVTIVCANCEHEHRIPERPLDRDRGGTVCPACGERGYAVRHAGLQWHP